MPRVGPELTLPFIVGTEEAFGEHLALRLEPWLTEDLEIYARSIAQMFNRVLEVAEEAGSEGEPEWIPAWGKLLSVELCPPEALGYLAQYVGIELPVTASTEEARAIIRREAGFQRGTTKAVEEAISSKLSGAKQFLLIERENATGAETGYWFVVVVAPAEVPSRKELEAAINKVKPGGVFYTIEEVTSPSWLSSTKTWETVAGTVTWANVKEGDT
jgi:hypothetical protein